MAQLILRHGLSTSGSFPGTDHARQGSPMTEYSQHAKKRMRQRKISETEVGAALRHRSGYPQPGDKGRTLHYGYAGSRKLGIVLEPDGTVHTVWDVDE
jgi:hypothetical protein